MNNLPIMTCELNPQLKQLIFDKLGCPKTHLLFYNPVIDPDHNIRELIEEDHGINAKGRWRPNYQFAEFIDRMVELFPELKLSRHKPYFNSNYLSYLVRKFSNKEIGIELVRDYINQFDISERKIVVFNPTHYERLRDEEIDDLKPIMSIDPYETAHIVSIDSIIKLFIDNQVEFCEEYYKSRGCILYWMALHSSIEMFNYILEKYDFFNVNEVIGRICRDSLFQPIYNLLERVKNFDLTNRDLSIMSRLIANNKLSKTDIENIIINLNIYINYKPCSDFLSKMFDTFESNVKLYKYMCTLNGHFLEYVPFSYKSIELCQIAYRTSPVDSCIKFIPEQIISCMEPFGSKTKPSFKSRESDSTTN
jgi:hypothetical protein